MSVRSRIQRRRIGLATLVAWLSVMGCAPQPVAFHGEVDAAGFDVVVTDATGNVLDVDFQPNPKLATPIEAGMGRSVNQPTRFWIWWTVTDDCDNETTLEITRSDQNVNLDLRRPRCDGPNPRTVQIAIDVQQPFDMQWTTLRVTDN